jgi:hypothetical protein
MVLSLSVFGRKDLFRYRYFLAFGGQNQRSSPASLFVRFIS